MRQREAVQAQQQAGDAGRVQRERRRIRQLPRAEPTEDEPDKQTGDDPANRAVNANQRELLFLITDVVEREGIGEPERGHVTQVVEEDQENK